MASKGQVEYGVLWGMRVAARDPYWPREMAIDDALAIRRLARVAGRDEVARLEMGHRAERYGAVAHRTDGGWVLRWSDGREVEVPT